ncbi:MAG: hypothetical protein K6E50_10745 [Lachnospiraceae bacterium]|nr:hypothetical protein [Lachnospiraceae bacterium]
MELFLKILAITGIVLGSILAFILLVLLLLLFVPWRYIVMVSKEDAFTGRFKLYWFLHLIVADLSYAGGMNLVIRILGIPFYDRERKRRKAEAAEAKEEERRRKKRKVEEEKRKKKEDAAKPSPEEKAEEPESNEPSAQSAAEDNKKDNAEEKAGTSAGKDRDSEKKDAEKEEDGNKSGRKEKIPLDERISDLLDQLEDTLGKMPDTIEEGGEAFLGILEKGCDKVEGVFETIEYYDRLLNSEGAHWVYDYVKKHGVALLKAIRPTRLDADLLYRDDDPGNVAKIYEYRVWSMPFTDLLKNDIRIDAMQGEKELRFHAKLSGRILLWAVAVHGGCLVLNKKVKAFWKRLKREE